MSFTKKNNLNIRISKYLKYLKHLYPLSNPQQNSQDLGCLDGTG